ncbi:MAG: hypothetical protein KDI71_12540 [Xanthomonadales bacterium]|nr:hypothetical protein [Xanthomonadales bacterium]
MRTSTLLLSGLALLAAMAPALADHHGRGHEPTDGFPGIYTSPRMTLTFTGDGYLIVVVNSSKVAAMVGQYTINEQILSLRDVSPPAFFPSEVQECVKTHEGKYRLADDGEQIQWELVEDPCAGRARLYGGMVMHHYVRPEPAADATASAPKTD